MLFCIACTADTRKPDPLFKQEDNTLEWDLKELELFDKINSYRIENKVNPLKLDKVHRELALMRNIDNTEVDSISHEGFATVHNILIEGKGLKRAGENLGYKYTKIETVLEAWKKSEDHNRNMLNPNWIYSGLSIYFDEKEKVNYYCQLFSK